MKGFSRRWLWPVLGALVCLALGTASGLSGAGGDGSWYRSLVKPPGTPPSWLFGPVWVFCMQMVLNLVWTPVFFGAQRIDAALAIISGLWFGIAALIQMGWKVDRISAALLLPYLVWVSYATYLNAGFYWLNW